MKSSLQIRTKRMSVDMQMNNHNLLRWTAMAIDTNEVLANSLIALSANSPVFLTDSFYMVTHPESLGNIPPNTHIVLWDGINSYIELLQLKADIAQRSDLKFFVVGWLTGHMLEQQISISPLYPPVAPADANDWGSLFAINSRFNVPYHYRALATLLSFSRYFKNWLADAKRHSELNKGGKIVFCGMVSPTEHQINGFFRGVDAPDLLNACLQLTQLNYENNGEVIDQVARKIILAFKSTALASVTDFACAYSILNLLHRVKTLSLLNNMSDALFINETKSNRWLDPYDSFFYRNNLYLDFGSTRGPDAIYPRTLDIVMKCKPYVSFRFLTADQTINQYLDNLTHEAFLQQCERDSNLAIQIYGQRFK